MLERKNKMTRKTAPMLDEILSSWVLDSLRKVIGYEDIRNIILQTMVPNKHVIYGKTFGSENTQKQLNMYLKKITTKTPPSQRYLLFTASNQAYQGETHYQTFVMDYSTKELWVIDPASVMGKEGIYKAYVATDTIIPFFHEKGWKTAFVKLTRACQSTSDDVFCQTWSIWLQIRFINRLLQKKSKTLSIPASLRTRYKELLRFYKKCIVIPDVCKELTITYRDTIKTSPILVKGHTLHKAKEIIRYYLSFDPCQEALTMNEMDLMTIEQHKNM